MAVAVVLLADLVAVPLVGRSDRRERRPLRADAVAATTTTRPDPIGVFPLTGLPAYPGDHPSRPALSIKVDNAPEGRPQSGLDAADIVTEELVEGGLTRLLVTFQSDDAAAVGPVRSVRPEDAPLVHELGGGILAFSGGSAGVLATVQSGSSARLVQPGVDDGAFRRDGSRAAPSNLFASTAALYRLGPAGPPPPSLFTFSTSSPTSPGGRVAFAFSGSSSAAWTWDGPTATYARDQDGSADTLAGGARVRTTNVVIVSVAVRGSGNYDVLHHETPLEVVVGSGPCWVLRDGRMVAGRWSRVSADVAIQLVGPDGQPIGLRPGPTWLELLPQPFRPQFSS